MTSDLLDDRAGLAQAIRASTRFLGKARSWSRRERRVKVDAEAVRAGIERAFNKLQQQYLTLGGWRYPGWRSAKEGHGYLGPWAWSEGDYQFHFARLLEEQFPGCVHIEFPLKAATRDDLGLAPGARGSTHVDIVISDLSKLPNDPLEAGRLFRSRRHEAFIEVKRFMKTTERWRAINWRDFQKGVLPDTARLSAHLQAGRCLIAAMLIVDDRGWQTSRMWELEMPDDVLYLVLQPPCPRCGAPEALPVVWGLPGPELAEQERQGKLILGGCLVAGDGSDARWQCKSCGSRWSDALQRA